MKIYLFVLPLLLICLFSGCAQPVQTTQPIEGVVTLDDVPLEGANITFHPKASDGSVAGGFSSAGGRFKVQTIRGEAEKGTTPGEYLVTVTKMESVPTGKKTRDAEGTVVEETTDHPVVPAIYLSPETTPIVVNVVKGTNKVDIKLVSSAK